MKPFAKKFYKSKAWTDCRNAYFTSQHGLCERCNGPGKIVHHTIYLNPNNIDDPNISLNHELLELLCQDCHNKEHHGSTEVLREDVMFDEEGNLVEVVKYE
ncbi:TPA: HNH endonuclease [Escherichia coli]